MESLRDIWVGTIVGAGTGILAGIADILKVAVLYLLGRLAVFAAIDAAFATLIDRSARGENGARVKTLKGLLKSVLGYVLFFVAGVMLLRAFGLDPVPVIATASVAGLAVGFGAQRLVRDVISGFFILLENQFAVGEYVSAAGVTGTIEEIGMRITRIRDDAGKLNIIANGDITTVCNHSRGSVKVSVEVSVASDVDSARVVELLNDEGERLRSERHDIIIAPKYVGIVGLDSVKTTMRFTGACEARAVEQVQMAMRERFGATLREAGIPLV